MNQSQQPKYKTVKLNQDQIRALSEDSRNIVYDFEEDKPKLAQPVPLNDVRKNIQDLYALWNLQRRERKVGESYAEKFRDKLRARCQRWQRFSDTHPTIFDNVTSPDATEMSINAIMVMIDMK